MSPRLEFSDQARAMGRREAMRVGGLAACGLSLTDLFRLRSLQAAGDSAMGTAFAVEGADQPRLEAGSRLTV